MTEAEIKQAIAQHEAEREKALMNFHYHDGMILQFRCKLNALSQEECSGISKLIGSGLPKTEGYVEEIPEGGRGYGNYKYRVIGRMGSPIHHTNSPKDAEDYLELCRKSWMKDYKEVGE